MRGFIDIKIVYKTKCHIDFQLHFDKNGKSAGTTMIWLACDHVYEEFFKLITETGMPRPLLMVLSLAKWWWAASDT